MGATHLREGLEHLYGVGQGDDGAHELGHPAVTELGIELEQVTYVDESEHSVRRAVDDRVAGVGSVPDHLGPLNGLHRPLQEVHLGSGHHDLTQGLLPDGEDLVEDGALLVTQGGRRDDHRADLLVGDLLAGSCGVTTKDLDDEIGRDTQEPDDRAEQGRNAVDHRAQHQGEPLGSLHGQPLGDQLSQHDREIRNDDRDDDEGDGAGNGGRHSPGLKNRRELIRQCGTTECRGQEARQGDANLDSRQEAVGI